MMQSFLTPSVLTQYLISILLFISLWADAQTFFFTYWPTEILEDPEPGPQCTCSSCARITFVPACSDFLGLIWLFRWKTVYSLSRAVLHPYTEARRSRVTAASALKMCCRRRTHGYCKHFCIFQYADLPRLSCEGEVINIFSQMKLSSDHALRNSQQDLCRLVRIV